MGDRVSNFDKALVMMKRSGISVICHSGLYESAPAYVTNQPRFLNSAIKARTRLDPSALLAALKIIESDLGRVFGTVRYGPRPIDLDILFYGERAVNEDHLTIPHPLIWERPFVVAPLMDLCSTNAAAGDAWNRRLDRAKDAWTQLDHSGLKQVIPSPMKLRQELWSCWQHKTYLMGILNITPDSFSDGGRYASVQDAVNRAESMASEGAHIIDLGAQSTRPGATKLSIDEELARLVPVLDAIRGLPSMESVCLSIDTFYSHVAREVVTKHGVHMVNDVSGGTLDPEMYATVAELGVPYVLMHMRGEPSTMQNAHHVNYGDVVEEVADELCDRLEKAESSGIPSWRIILDLGLGFSKTAPQNLHLLGNLSVLKSRLSKWSFAASKAPMLIGPSRKSFLGTICGREKAEDRDLATIGAAVAGIAQGANILRLHNIKASVDAVRVADAIFKPKS
jgi:2-amino-4-hydroxy-6-hydroxymethyldihydropteridine diphosphokinase/dihydropteroate synthase